MRNKVIDTFSDMFSQVVLEPADSVLEKLSSRPQGGHTPYSHRSAVNPAYIAHCLHTVYMSSLMGNC